MNLCHCNINIIRYNRVVYVKEWVDAGVLQLRQLVNLDGHFVTFAEFKHHFPMIDRTNFLVYEGIINSIRQSQRKLHIEVTGHQKVLVYTKVWGCIYQGNRHVQSVLVRSGTVVAAVGRWNELFDNLNWGTQCFKSTGDMQLRWFQARLLHRVLPTIIFLFACTIVDDPLCSFCSDEVETIQHIFWNCAVVRNFWDALSQLLRDNCTHCFVLFCSDYILCLVILSR